MVRFGLGPVPAWNLYRFWNMDRLSNSHPCAGSSIAVDDPGHTESQT